MKVELDEKGMLFVTPETPLEVFALNHWWALFSPALGSVATGGAGIGVREIAPAR
jgi:hypothetical protein